MMGLLDDLTGTTAADRNKIAMKRELERRVDQWLREPRMKGALYAGAADIILKHGQFFAGRVMPEEYRHLVGTNTHCFANALAAVRADPSLRYFEGVYSVGLGLYTTHAWAVTPAGDILEVSMPTWDIGDGCVYFATANGGKMEAIAVERWAYWGVEIHPDYVEALIPSEGQPIIDRSLAEELSSEAMGLDLIDTRTEWTFLTKLYEPARRQP